MEGMPSMIHPNDDSGDVLRRLEKKRDDLSGACKVDFAFSPLTVA
jgi:hypothetical protein